MSTLPKVVQNLIENFEDLPGIGPRSAARLAYFFLRAPDNFANKLSDNLKRIKTEVKVCTNCFNYSDSEICSICLANDRSQTQIMVVEDPLDVVAFERMGQFKGVYHVLGGLISPINGIGPEELRIDELIERLKKLDIEELIIATNPNLEGESTALYIKKMVDQIGRDITITRLARGLPTGADLEYADDVTLQRALEGRGEF